MDQHRKERIMRALHAHIGKGKEYTQQSVAKELRVDQGRISRIMNGGFSRDEGVVRRLYQFIGLNPDTPESEKKPQESTVLIDALSRNWDGSDEHAYQLAKIIDEVGKISRWNNSRPAQQSERS